MMSFLQSLLSAAPNGSGAVATAAPLTAPLTINGKTAAKTPEGAPAIDFKKQQMMGGLLSALASGGVNALGNMNGGGESGQQQMIQAPAYRGGGYYQSSGAGNISKMRRANGLLAQR